MTYEDYRKFIREVQDTLEDDDCVRDIAQCIIEDNNEVRDFLVNILNEFDPVRRLENDLY